jgi:hypothetical protein
LHRSFFYFIKAKIAGPSTNISHHKNHNTVWFLVDLLTFGYFHLHLYKLENEAKQTTLNDGLLDKLEHCAVVMADGGLLIADEVYYL